MATVIISDARTLKTEVNDIESKAMQRVMSLLPTVLAARISSALEAERQRGRCNPEEIRLRADRRVYLTVGCDGGKKNLPLAHLLTKDELSLIFERMCGGSLYAYGESIRKGFISLGFGVRVGICGRASLEGEKIRSISEVTSLNIRLPCGICRIERGLYEPIVRSIRDGGGVLIYSPPAEGKTTLLRSLCASLSGGEYPMRVAAVDSRDELGVIPHPDDHSVDVLAGYPKAEAISIATAFMNPEVILCDEIGSSEEARAILEAQNCGVPLVATAHGDSLHTLLRRPQIRLLHDSGVFSLYVGIRISDGSFEYSIQTCQEARDTIEDDRDSYNADLRLRDRATALKRG